MNASEAIENLRTMSAALDRCANKPENYNTQWAQYLEQMSFEMHKQANDLSQIAYMFDLPTSLTA